MTRTSRTFTRLASPAVRIHLDELLGAPDPVAYRASMQTLGHALGRAVVSLLGERRKVLLTCTVEDADFLANGLLAELMEGIGPSRVSLACFWNDRTALGVERTVEIAPIRRRYVEPHARQLDAVVVVKSIISTACVIRTNLLDLLDETSTKRIIVAAPVMHRDATTRLEQEFPRNRREVRVRLLRQGLAAERRWDRASWRGRLRYERLGLGSARSKNQYSPTLVRARRRQNAASN